LCPTTRREIKAEEQATQRERLTSFFLTGSPSQTLARLGKTDPLFRHARLIYAATKLDAFARPNIRTIHLAQKRLTPGGLFVTSYHAYDKEDGACASSFKNLHRKWMPHRNRSS